MILLNKEIKSVINIDRDLVRTYKSSCDTYLVAIKRNLTKQLVDYRVYYKLQLLDNAFGKIINNLLNDTYDDIDLYEQDKHNFEVVVNDFEGYLADIISERLYNTTLSYLNRLGREMTKLYYIIENYCYVPEDE